MQDDVSEETAINLSSSIMFLDICVKSSLKTNGFPTYLYSGNIVFIYVSVPSSFFAISLTCMSIISATKRAIEQPVNSPENQIIKCQYHSATVIAKSPQ